LLASRQFYSAKSGDVKAFFDLLISAAHHQVDVVRDFASGIEGPINISEFDGALKESGS